MFGPCKKDTGRGRVLERFYASISSGAAKSFPAIQESDSGHDQGGRQADIENRNERIGKQSEGAGSRSETPIIAPITIHPLISKKENGQLRPSLLSIRFACLK